MRRWFSKLHFFSNVVPGLASQVLRNKKFIFVFLPIGGFLAIAFVALAGHQAIEVTESTAFCAQVCHQVHAAEYTTFQESPHSNVNCSACHVGEGLDNFVSSKLGGIKDILPAITGDYNLPLHTRPGSQRPSEVTCSACHRPEKFTGDLVRVKTKFAPDETNTKDIDTLVLKVGGGKAEVAGDIHWHVAAAKVWYLPLDDKRLQIGWVGVENKDGTLTEYIDTNRQDVITPARINSEKRLMDCVDCHNRVAHQFRSPDDLLNAALADGSISPELPFIKLKGLQALDPVNSSLEESYAKIGEVRDFYETSYPQIFEEKSQEIDKATDKLKEIARLTTFPDKKVNWTTYFNQLGHDRPDENMEIDWEKLSTLDQSPGCFRCHGNLVPVNGKVPAGEPAQTDTIDASLFGTAEKPIGVSTGALIGERLDATCNSCHYTLESAPSSPLAPATPHPVDRLDDCLACHAESAARPFKTEHPWSTNEACNACHQSAPKVKDFPVSDSEPAKATSHTVNGLEDCLVCHATSGTQPVKNDHPWSTNDTCSACHQSAEVLKPMPVSQVKLAKAISHTSSGLDDCLLCHNPGAPAPVSTEHPWSTNDTCSSCHQSAPVPKPMPVSQGKPATAISHGTNGLSDCVSCHGQGALAPVPVTHPWSTNTTCTVCHKPSDVSLPPPSGGLPAASPISHGVAGLTDCTSCHGAGIGPYPGDHVGRPGNWCGLCHSPVTLPPPTSNPPPLGPRIPHGTASLADCLSCHGQNGVRPVTATHTGRTNATCTACHQAPSSTVPAAPSGLTAMAASATQVNLSWTDNSNNETGFRIQRATNSGFSAGLTTFTVGAGVTTHSNTPVTASTTYYYRVIAYNTAGDSAAVSTSVTTPAPALNGSAIYAANCTSCHGVMSNTNRTQAQLITWIPTHQTGRNLTAAEVAAIAAYLKP